MDFVQWLALALFLGAIVAIIFEHHFLVPKAATALTLAAVLWVMRSLSSDADTEREAMEAAAEVVGIFLFLFSAMLLVEVLRHYKFFDVIRRWLYSKGYGNRQQFIVISIIAFVLSAILDNLTTTLVMITVAERFFLGRNKVVVAAGIVMAANAGGAFSPIGDVTTIMLWVAGKYSAGQVVAHTFLPSLTSFIVTVVLLARLVTNGANGSDDSTEELEIVLTRSEKVVIGMSLGCFSLPLVATMLDLPPFLGLMGGLGVVWLTVEQLKGRMDHETHLQADIDRLLKDVEYASLAFFAGILLSVDALNVLGVLEQSTHVLLGNDPSNSRIAVSMIGLGWLSAVVDNVPLTALAMDAIPTHDSGLWSLLAFTVGTGGSHLIVGSAAGVVAMSKVRELDSVTYIKLATFPVLVGYVAGVLVWAMQQLVV